MSELGHDTRAPAPRLVELMGPPGAGKSTVFEALAASVSDVAPPPLLRKTEPLLFLNLTAVAATLLRRRVSPLRLSVEQVRTMVYVQALPDIVHRALPARAIVFDQGPLFSLTRPALTGERLADWRARWLEVWSQLLDVVVWLDAPDAALVERINSRGKWHRLKGRGEQAVRTRLDLDRAVYGDVLAELEQRAAGPAVLRVDTGTTSPGETAGLLTAMLFGPPASEGARPHSPGPGGEVVPAESTT